MSYRSHVACVILYIVAILASLVLFGGYSYANPNWPRTPTDDDIRKAAENHVSKCNYPATYIYEYQTFKLHQLPNGPNEVLICVRKDDGRMQGSILAVFYWLDYGCYYNCHETCEPQFGFGGFRPAFASHWESLGSCAADMDHLFQLAPEFARGWLGESPPSENRPPTVRLSYSPANPTPNDTIHFQADASDPDGDPLTYRWFLNDVEQTRATAPNVQWANPAPGTHTMRIVVSDDKGGMAEDSVEFTVQAGNRPPRLELRPPENPELVFTQEYGFTYKYCFQAVSYDDDKDQMTHEWFFDGQQASNIGTVEGSPTDYYSVASSYSCWLPVSQGSHTVVVKASDGKGGAAEKEYSFTMKGQWVHVRMTGGKAQLRIGDQLYDLEKGVEVSITDGIRSGDVSIRCWEGTTVYLVFADGSKLYFDCRSPSIYDDPGGGTISIDHGPLGESLEIGPGNVRVHVQNVKIDRWEAAGWHGGTLGTDFEIDVQPNGTVTVYTFDGVVWFADSQETKVVHIRAGENSIGVPGSVPSDPKPFDSSSFERWWESEIPPLPGTKTIEQALDTDRDRIIGDLEMLQALQYWIKQQIVPGTNKTIDDLTMLALLQKWIKGTPIQ